MCHASGADGENQSGHSKKNYSAWCVFLLWCDFGYRCAESKSADQTANVAGVVDATKHTAKEQVEYCEDDEAAEGSPNRNLRKRELAKIERSD